MAIGAPYEDWASVADDGVVHLLFGAPGGLNEEDPYQLVPQRTGLEIAPGEEGDRFGSALAIGDLDDDGWGDLVVAAPSKYDAAGSVQILWGALFADEFERGNVDGWGP